jgi:long-subunit acyl-CoA synthetase (AMP-forming)
MYQPGSLFPIPALSSDGYLRWTHAQLHHAAKLLASGLKTQGVSKGQAIATFLYNSAEWNVLARASAILGCPFVPLNPRAVGNLTEVQHMLRISGAQVIVVTDVEMARRLGDGLPEVFTRMKFKFVLEKDLSALPGEWTGFYGLFENVNVKDDKVNGTLPAEEEDDAALIVFTSGKYF